MKMDRMVDAMKLLTFYEDNELTLGVKVDKGILHLEKALDIFPNPSLPKTVEEVLAAGEAGLEELEQYVQKVEGHGVEELFLSEEELNFGPAVPNPGKIICVGLNYRKHADESNMPYPEEPILFSKFNNALSAHNDTVTIPRGAEQIDYEAELTIVIGKEAKDVKEEEALNYVFGYSNGNDLSIRERQFKSGQWLLGKTADGFCPVGPYLVTADEIENPNDLPIRLSVNGNERQNSSTADMIFNCKEIISYVSKYMTLQPGDIILTGTPEGVIMGYPEGERNWLQDGDEVTVEIEKLGRLTTRFSQE